MIKINKVYLIIFCISVLLFITNVNGQSKMQVKSSDTADDLPACCRGLGCSCAYDMTPEGVMYGHTHEKGMFMLSASYMDMNMGGNIQGASQVSDPGLFNQGYQMASPGMNMQMIMLMAMYGISDKLTLMVMGGYSYMKMPMNMLLETKNGIQYMNMYGGGGVYEMPLSEMGVSNTTAYSRSSGLGDISVCGIYNAYSRAGQKVLLTLGISLPTGSINVPNTSGMYGATTEYSMQLGSGTVDYLPAITYIHTIGKTSWGVSGAAVVRSGYNAMGYKLGNEETITTWAAHKLKQWLSVSIRAEATNQGTIHTVTGSEAENFNYSEPDAGIANSGGQHLNAYAGVNFYLNSIIKNSRLAVEYGLPVYQNVNGIQNATKNMLYAGWRISF